MILNIIKLGKINNWKEFNENLPLSIKNYLKNERLTLIKENLQLIKLHIKIEE